MWTEPALDIMQNRVLRSRDWNGHLLLNIGEDEGVDEVAYLARKIEEE